MPDGDEEMPKEDGWMRGRWGGMPEGVSGMRDYKAVGEKRVQEISCRG
jgi:hypothetical protein